MVVIATDKNVRTMIISYHTYSGTENKKKREGTEYHHGDKLYMCTQTSMAGQNHQISNEGLTLTVSVLLMC